MFEKFHETNILRAQVSPTHSFEAPDLHTSTISRNHDFILFIVVDWVDSLAVAVVFHHERLIVSQIVHHHLEM